MGCRGDQEGRPRRVFQESVLSRIVRSAASLRDLNIIWGYIANDSPMAADEFVDRIDARLHTLAEHPFIGSDRSQVRPGLRSVSEGNYTLYYRPMPDGVRLMRIVHAARYLAKVFPNR